MTADALMVVQFLFSSIWSLFTSWHFPGTNVSPAAMAFFLLAASVILKIVKVYLFGGGDDG